MTLLTDKLGPSLSTRHKAFYFNSMKVILFTIALLDPVLVSRLSADSLDSWTDRTSTPGFGAWSSAAASDTTILVRAFSFGGGQISADGINWDPEFSGCCPEPSYTIDMPFRRG